MSIANIAHLSSQMESLSKDQLIKLAQNPDPSIPNAQLLALTQLGKIQDTEKRMQAEQARAQGPQPTTAQQILMQAQPQPQQMQQPQQMNMGGIVGVRGFRDGGAAAAWKASLEGRAANGYGFENLESLTPNNLQFLQGAIPRLETQVAETQGRLSNYMRQPGAREDVGSELRAQAEGTSRDLTRARQLLAQSQPKNPSTNYYGTDKAYNPESAQGYDPMMGPPQPYSPRLPPDTGARGVPPGYRSGIPLEAQEASGSRFQQMRDREEAAKQSTVDRGLESGYPKEYRQTGIGKQIEDMRQKPNDPLDVLNRKVFGGASPDLNPNAPGTPVSPLEMRRAREGNAGLLGNGRLDIEDWELEHAPPFEKSSLAPSVAAGATGSKKPSAPGGLGDLDKMMKANRAEAPDVRAAYLKNREALGGGKYEKMAAAQRAEMKAERNSNFWNNVGIAGMKMAGSKDTTLAGTIAAGGVDFFTRSAEDEKDYKKEKRALDKMDIAHQEVVSQNAMRVTTGQITADQAAEANNLSRARLDLDYRYKNQVLNQPTDKIRTIEALIGKKLGPNASDDTRREAMMVVQGLSGASVRAQGQILSLKRRIDGEVGRLRKNPDNLLYSIMIPGSVSAAGKGEMSVAEALQQGKYTKEAEDAMRRSVLARGTFDGEPEIDAVRKMYGVSAGRAAVKTVTAEEIAALRK